MIRPNNYLISIESGQCLNVIIKKKKSFSTKSCNFASRKNIWITSEWVRPSSHAVESYRKLCTTSVLVVWGRRGGDPWNTFLGLMMFIFKGPANRFRYLPGRGAAQPLRQARQADPCWKTLMRGKTTPFYWHVCRTPFWESRHILRTTCYKTGSNGFYSSYFGWRLNVFLSINLSII